MPAPKVSVIQVTSEKVNPSKEFVGKTEAKEDVNIQARVQGYLVKQHVGDGVNVKKGDLLFELDSDTYDAEVTKAQAKVAQDKAAEDEAQRNYKRGKELIVKGAISESQMDQLTSKKLQADAAIKVSKAALKTAELNLSYTKIHASTDGSMSQAKVSIGDLITPSTTLATLVKTDPMYVSFQISERELITFREERMAAKQAGKPMPELIAKLKLPTGTIYPHEGAFDFLDNRVDQTTGTIKIRAQFPNPDNFLLPGQHVTMLVERGEGVDQLVIPQKSIQEDQSGKFVLILGEDNLVEKRPVELGSKKGINYAVKSGLEVGEQVIVDGLQKVRIGGKATSQTATLPAAK
ncbi:multidrug efflux RND transporter periplasmic adaptor subunit VmeY [Litoribacillus peritrichatus]|uniref:Multidrug efflux RND transporter periplasmic adaptor subunit VmeY n=2 Tax=Litoribacillus peritrichatus TaxID=718191 RepID=A0ABP7M129_9GAMM